MLRVVTNIQCTSLLFGYNEDVWTLKEKFKTCGGAIWSPLSHLGSVHVGIELFPITSVDRSPPLQLFGCAEEHPVEINLMEKLDYVKAKTPDAE